MDAMAYVRIPVRHCGAFFFAGSFLAATSLCPAGAATKEDVDRCRAIEQRAERLDCFKALKRNKPAKTESAAPVETTKKDDGLPAKAGDPAATSSAAPSSRPDTPTTTSAINRVDVGSGRPLCVDRDALAGMLIAGLLTADPARAATPGCQALPADAKLQIVERFPGIFPFMRMVAVRVTSPARPDLTAGFTIELDSLTTEGSSLKAPQ
jgi:hypothetical protein